MSYIINPNLDGGTDPILFRPFGWQSNNLRENYGHLSFVGCCKIRYLIIITSFLLLAPCCPQFTARRLYLYFQLHVAVYLKLLMLRIAFILRRHFRSDLEDNLGEFLPAGSSLIGILNFEQLMLVEFCPCISDIIFTLRFDLYIYCLRFIFTVRRLDF